MSTFIRPDAAGMLEVERQPEPARKLFKNLAEFTSEDKTLLDSAIESLQVKTAEISFLGSTITLRKTANIVQLSYFGQSKVELTGSAEVTAGTLPEGFRPAERVCRDLFNSSTAKIQITFNTDGTVKIYNFGATFAANQGWIRDFYTFISQE